MCKKARRGVKTCFKTWKKEIGVVTIERKNACRLYLQDISVLNEIE
jgi:hypothetical protein